jgi:phosphate starvation-inducible protein PhoH and related proteins
MSRKPSSKSRNKAKTKADDGRGKKANRRLEYEMDVLSDMDKSFKAVETNFRIVSKFKNAKQKDFYNKILDPNTRIVFVKGSAGTGKTYISMLAALECLKDRTINIDKILISKVIVPSGRDFGFLKGSLAEKTEPYFTSYWSNISKLIGTSWTTRLKAHGVIEEAVVNFMRGDTFGSHDNDGNPVGVVAIMDEAQNTTVAELKTFVSRMGENSKLIVMGDNDQIDIKLNKNDKSGLDDAFDRFKGIKGIEYVEFTEDDIVRDPFLIEIMKRYKTA